MRRALAACAALAALASCGRGSDGAVTVDRPSPSPEPTAAADLPEGRVIVRFDEGAEVRAELALTRAQQLRGLMFREELGADDGMLFVFQQPQSDGFWMKNTLIPLSIAYLRRTADRSYEVVAILDMEPCPPDAQTCPPYPPGEPYDAALEVNVGWFERAGVGVGATATVDGDVPVRSPGA